MKKNNIIKSLKTLIFFRLDIMCHKFFDWKFNSLFIYANKNSFLKDVGKMPLITEPKNILYFEVKQ